MDLTREKARITWVTADYFIDCDFNIEVLEEILKIFDIHWILLLPRNNARFDEKDFMSLKGLRGLTMEFIYWDCRARNPRMLLFYKQIYSRIKLLKSSLIYFNDAPTSPYVLPLYWRLDKKKTIVTAHDGNVKPSFKMPLISKIVFKMSYHTVKYVNMFSASQSKLFKLSFDRAKIFTIPLSLKNFGDTSSQPMNSEIRFLFFGSIHSNKNLELLIEAACNLYENGITGFKIIIHGFCSNWNYYKLKIKYPEIFEHEIRIHTNAEIPKLFSENHYSVFPYKEVSQSGAIKVALNYGLPVIVSDLSAFTDEIKNDINGFVFKSEDVGDLERVLAERILKHSSDYPIIKRKFKQYNEENFSNKSIAKKYIDMFNEVLSIK